MTDARREPVEAGMFTREQLDKALALIFHKGTPAMQEVVMEVLAHDGALRQALARQAQRLKELETRCNNFPIDAPMWRGVEPDDTCAECGGSGTKVYANTSTFHYGAGGQSMTLSVCDKCWGSGDRYRPWPSWKTRRAEAYADGQRAEQKRMSKYVNMRLTQSKTLLQAEIVAGNTVKQGHERAAIAELHGVLQQIRQAAGEVTGG